ncbi:hypothetical protein GJ496_002967 [Pomphorhynchus laevis]|nr:hypothetical protein GJ496_002967 [Pomphorhynchus laevis]
MLQIPYERLHAAQTQNYDQNWERLSSNPVYYTLHMLRCAVVNGTQRKLSDGKSRNSVVNAVCHYRLLILATKNKNGLVKSTQLQHEKKRAKEIKYFLCHVFLLNYEGFEHNNSDKRSFRSIFHRKFYRSRNTKERSVSMLNCTNNNESDMSLPTTYNSNNLLDDIDCKYDGRNGTSSAIKSYDKQNTGCSNSLKYSERNGTIDSRRSVSMTNGENKVSSAGHYGSSRSIFSAFRNKFHLPKDRHLNVNSEKIICDPATPTVQRPSSQQTGKDRRLRLFSRFRSRSSKERQRQPSASSQVKQLTKSPSYNVDGATNSYADSSQTAYESNTVDSSTESANLTSDKRIISTLNDSLYKQNIEKQYESILNRYKLDNQKLSEFTFPSLYDSRLSKTSQSTVRIACLLNGYNPLNDCNRESTRIYDGYIARDRLPPRPRNREPSHSSHTNVGVFNFEPFYNIAARRSSRMDRRLVKDEESSASITKSNIHVHEISNTSDIQSAVPSSNFDSFIVDDKLIGLSQLADIYHDTLTRVIDEQQQLIQNEQNNLNKLGGFVADLGLRIRVHIIPDDVYSNSFV